MIIINQYTTPIPLGSKTLNFNGIEIKIFDQHRTAFYHWGEWRKIHQTTPPHLVTFDYHCDYDICIEPSTKRLLNCVKNSLNRSFITSFSLDKNNDNHIGAALYMNYLNNVFALEHGNPSDILNYENKYSDIDNNIHTIAAKCHIDDFFKLLDNQLTDTNKIYLDIDLDYFTLENKSNVILKPQKTIIKEMNSIKTNILDSSKYNICGITIATEPACCGSLANSYSILTLLDSILFNNNLLSSECNYE